MGGTLVVPAQNWSTSQKIRVRGGSSLGRCGQPTRAVAAGSLSMGVKLGDRSPNSAARTVIRT